MLCRARTGAPGDVAPHIIAGVFLFWPSGGEERDGPFENVPGDGHLIDNVDELRELLAFGHRHKAVPLRAERTRGNIHLVGARRVLNVDTQHEAVELRLGQWIGALLLDRILGGHNNEWRGQLVGFAVHGHSQFLHCFQKGGLRLGRRAVDFVSENEVGEDWAAMKNQIPPPARLVALQNLGTRDIRRHKIGRELDAPKIPAEQVRQRLHHHRLGQPGHADDEHMSAGNQSREQ